MEQFFAERIPHGRPQDYLIRVNRQPVSANQVLQKGDRVSFTPTKIEGADRRPGRAKVPAAVIPPPGKVGFQGQ